MLAAQLQSGQYVGAPHHPLLTLTLNPRSARPNSVCSLAHRLGGWNDFLVERHQHGNELDLVDGPLEALAAGHQASKLSTLDSINPERASELATRLR